MIGDLARYLHEQIYPDKEFGLIQSLLTKPENLKEALKVVHEKEYSEMPFGDFMKKVEESPVRIENDPKYKPYDFEANNPEFSKKIKYMREVLNQGRQELPQPPSDPSKAKAVVLYAKYEGANTNGPNTDVFELEAKRALPLLKKKYGNDVAVVEVPYGDYAQLKQILEKYKNADVFPFDHSGDNIMGIPVSGVGMDNKEPSVEDVKYMLNPEDFEKYLSLKKIDDENKLKDRSNLKAAEINNSKYRTDNTENFIHNLNERAYEDTGKPIFNRKNTWSTAFPKDNKGRVCWGSCEFDKQAQDFTNESKIPSVSTSKKHWNGVAGMHGAINSDEDFLKYVYHNSDYIKHLPE